MAGKIIFVNSYKGGAGKTTLSMMHCIDALFHTKKYKNVIYMDLDILGTGTRYLFDEKKLPEDKCFDNTGTSVPITLKKGTETALLHIAYLSPSFNGHFSLGGLRFINHQEMLEKTLEEKVIKFLQASLKAEAGTLFILDCAPGFSRFEQHILKKCYDLASKEKLEIQEDYVTTLDSSHIKKCIQCLIDSKDGFEMDIEHRKIRFIINDMQNYTASLSDPDKTTAGNDPAEAYWKNVKKSIKKEFADKELSNEEIKKIEFFRWKYSSHISNRTTFLKEQKLENDVDDYIFQSGNFGKI